MAIFYGYACMAMYVWLCMYGYVCMALYVWLCMYEYVCMAMCVWLCVYVCTAMHAMHGCMYVSIYWLIRYTIINKVCTSQKKT